MNEEAHRIGRGHRAASALEEFVAPAIEAATAAYMARIKEIISREPWNVEKVKALMTAVRISEEVGAQLSAFVEDGKLASSDQEAVRRIEKMPEAKRRWI